jgi:hypothetical protein
MTEAEERFLDTLAAELEQILGPGIAIVGMAVVGSDDRVVRIRVDLDTSVGPWEFVGSGETLVEAAAASRRAAADARTAVAFRRLMAATDRRA